MTRESVPLRYAIGELLDHPTEGALDRKLARTILGTEDVEAIASRVEEYARSELGREVAGCFLFIQSVGAVFGVELDSGERVVLKAHAIGGSALRAFASFEELGAAYDAHTRMVERGFPCARVLRAPRLWPGGAVAAMSFLDTPSGDDPHEPRVRRAMAEGLARSVELGRSLGDLRLPRVELPRDAVFPPPHNALFDFSVPGGEWIDERARTARAVLDAEPGSVVVMHTDFSGANVRVIDGNMAAVFDMDSVAWIDEMRCLASVAVHFTYREGQWTWPTRQEAIAFVSDYIRARGRPLADREKRPLDAAAIYAMAYTSRCEHGMRPGEKGPMQRLLCAAPEAYFDSGS
jgi:hypothetical protein